MKKQTKRNYITIIGIFLLIAVFTLMFRVTLIHVFGLSEGQAATIASFGQVIIDAMAAIMIVFQLQQGRDLERSQRDIDEAQFILQYNQSFIQDPNMCYVEQSLERKMLGKTGDAPIITEENRQLFVNYLVYLESLAPLILQNVLTLEHIDDLMAYRFFLAVNDPEVQESELFAFPDYYRGCFKLYDKWKTHRRSANRPIPRIENDLCKWEGYETFTDNQTIVRTINSNYELASAADILYGTDPYIYPAAFSSPKIAQKVMPHLMQIKNCVFHASNIRVAVIGGTIAGAAVIFDKTATAKIDPSEIRAVYRRLPASFDDVCSRYFNSLPSYITPGADDLYIACICVSAEYRKQRIGEILLKNLIAENKGRKLSLHVLADNASAISLYEKYGFKKVGNPEFGYAYQSPGPLCYLRVRM